MLNLEQDSIVDVFCDMTAAAENRQFNGVSAISTAIKKGSQSGGHIFRMWHDCSEELKNAFLEHKQLPAPRKRVGAIEVMRVNPLTGEEVPFGSIAAVQRKLRVSRVTLKSCLDNQAVLKGYQWKLSKA